MIIINLGYILAHDLGTSGNKASLYDLNGNLCASSVYEYKTYYPKVSWAEQDPEDWWKAVCISTGELIKKSAVSKGQILCIAFSAQMMGCLPVDREGKPLRKSIIWADLRAVKQAQFIENAVGMEKVYRITGHRIGASYTAAKLLWIKENEPEVYSKAYKILQAKDYIVSKLTGKFVTDYSDASGTNLFDINKKQWSKEVIKAIDINENILPEVHPSTDVVGKVSLQAALEVGLAEGTPVVIGGGDGSCAAVGAGVVEKGHAYSALGSSSWISLATEQPIYDPTMRTFNFIHLDENLYAPCGTMQSAGYSYSWLKNNLCGLERLQAEELGISPYEIINKKIEESEPGAKGLLFLPYLLGERSPHWNPDAKGAFVGLNITHTSNDIYRSVLEGVTFNLKNILDIFEGFTPLDKVILIGGGAKGKIWLQIISDIWQRELLVPKYLEEATSMGAAICGGVGIGAFDNFKVIKKFNNIVDEITPRKEYRDKYNDLYNIFNEAYKALVPVYNSLSKIN